MSEVNKFWAESLSNARLAELLRKAAAAPRHFAKDQRVAMMNEAANRLERNA